MDFDYGSMLELKKRHAPLTKPKAGKGQPRARPRSWTERKQSELSAEAIGRKSEALKRDVQLGIKCRAYFKNQLEELAREFSLDQGRKVGMAETLEIILREWQQMRE